MIKSDSHDSGVEYHSQNETLIRENTTARARRARRQNRNNSMATTSGDETRREVPNNQLRPPPSREARRRSPNQSDRPSLNESTTVTVENEKKPRRPKKTFKEAEGQEIEMAVRRRSGSRQRPRKPIESKEGPSEAGRTTTVANPRRNDILGIIVHRTDRLKMDVRLQHPFVRVHLIDANTRSYLRKTDPNRLVLRYHNQVEAPGDYIPSISTNPYGFNANRSTIPSWEEMLVINEEYSHFTTVGQQNVYAFFEILDFLDNPQTPNDRSNTFPIAWAFLKIIGARNTLNTGKMLRLQMWQPMELIRSSTPQTPDVLLWFNHGRHEKYPSTLYVTVKPVDSPHSYNPGLRSVVAGDIEQMRAEYALLKPELERQVLRDSNAQLRDSQAVDQNNQLIGPLERVAQLPPRWNKFPNSKAKVPTEASLFIKSGERGCSSIRFSHNGYFLACAEVSKSQENHLIQIYEMPGGQRVTTFSGHLQLIYELDWSRSDRYLVSASADFFVKIWNFAELERKPWRTLAHPSYVYAARFHPADEDIVVTAGYDKLLRVWSIQKKHGTVMRTMADHLGYISSLSFNPDGTRLASVDSNGAIKMWHGLPIETSASQRFADSWSLEASLEFPELQDVPLNSVTFSPGDNYLLVSARNNSVILIDVRTRSISRRYLGAFNVQDRIRSTFSSCGSLVFSGSEDRQVYCWQTYDGSLIYSYKSLNYTAPVLDIQFHPQDNIVAMCAIGPLHQVNVFHHTFNDPDVEAKTLQQSFTNRRGLGSLPPTTIPTVFSDSEQKPPLPSNIRYNRSSRDNEMSGTERPMGKSRVESSSDDVPTTDPSRGSDNRNRRLAVVNKILDDMEDFINPKSNSSVRRDSMTNYGGGHMMSRATERDVSPYQGRRSMPSSGYNSDSGRPPLVSPLRGLTSPDLFVPMSNRTDDDDDIVQEKGSASSSGANPIMYATINYRAQRDEELSFSKNDPIKIIKKESHLLWYAEHIPTHQRGYVSPTRVHINAREAYPPSPSSSATKPKKNTDSISDIPRLDNNSRRVAQKSVTFNDSD